jgi:hypothetical protein
VAAQATLADPFLVRDQNPLLRGVYLPVSRPAMMPDRSWTQDFTLTVSNTTNIESRNGAQLLVDGESTELRWIGNWRLSRHWQMQLSVPFVHYGGGQLDSFIDDWHRLLGLPRGDRPARPEDELEFAYHRADGAGIDITDSHTGFADSSVEIAYTLMAAARGTVNFWVGVELPTGDRDALTGNGSVDAAAWMNGAWQLSTRWQLDATLGITRPGSVEPLPLTARAMVPFGTFALSWRGGASYGLSLQFDAHDSCIEDSNVEFLGAAVMLTAGGYYRGGNGWRFEFGASEDVRVGASPDVVFFFGIRRQH